MYPKYKVAIKSVVLGLLLFGGIPAAFGAPPPRWIPRGVGGGGAFFGPSINPHNPKEVFIACDMSEIFRSKDLGASWEMLNFRNLKGHMRMTGLQYTSDSNVLYALSSTVPSKSIDGGTTWSELDPGVDPVYCVYADLEDSNTLFVADDTKIFFSSDGGRNFSAVYTNSDLHIAGAFFNGAEILIATRYGLLVSTNSGRKFSPFTTTGIPSTEGMVSFTGARQNGTNRFLCVTWNQNNIHTGIMGVELAAYRGVYSLNYGQSSAWSRATNGIGNYILAFIAMASSNTAVAYAAGTTAGNGYPAVFKTINGGTAWTQIFQISSNKNIYTGWRGDCVNSSDAWQEWWWGPEPLGFNVCPTDPNRVIVTDMGFVHYTTNGGATWCQAYVNRLDQNATNTLSQAGKDYHSAGLENTACWSVEWASTNCMIASYTDIHGTHSEDGGITWTFPTGLVMNTTYEVLTHPTNGKLYAAVSSIHNLYAYNEFVTDDTIDGGTGTIMVSQDCGNNWQELPGFPYPAVSLALDPNTPNRMFVSGVNSSGGGIFVSSNFQSGAGTKWTKLANPPRTEGHPYKIHVLKDGTLACSYSGRVSGDDFTDSSGVFVSTNGGASWLDRTADGMRYWTEDLTIDPNDSSQQTWYAGVYKDDWSAVGVPGLYRTTNRGIAWTRILTNLDAVGSATVNPANPNELYVTTKNEGLWYTANARAAKPTFVAATNYPFKHPTRVFFNPYDRNEIWIVSFGGGLMMGRATEPEPWVDGVPDPVGVYTQIVVSAEAGQRVVIMASSDMFHWSCLATNTVLDSTVEFTDPFATGSSGRFYMAKVEP